MKNNDKSYTTNSIFEKEIMNTREKCKLIAYDDITGNVEIEATFRNGLLNGKYLQYDDQGRLLDEINFLNDLEEGLSVRYKQGIKWLEENNKEGKQDGEWKEYYINGQVRTQGFIKNGVKVDLWIWWDENGLKRYERNYINNGKEFIDESGNINKENVEPRPIYEIGGLWDRPYREYLDSIGLTEEVIKAKGLK